MSSGNVGSTRTPPAEDAHRRNIIRRENRRGFPRPMILAEAKATSGIGLSQTPTIVAGATLSLTSPGLYLVTIVCSFQINAIGAGDCYGRLYQDGGEFDSARQAILRITGTSDTIRATIPQTYIVPVDGSTLPSVLAIYGDKENAGGTALIMPFDTVITALGGGGVLAS